MEYYFAYGSNLSIQQMNERGCKILGKPIKGVLKGYRLGFTTKSSVWGNMGVADIIEKNPNDSVKGVLYPIADIKPMDKAEVCEYGDEESSKYYRKILPIQTDKGEIKAWVYYVVKKVDFIQPSLRYVKQIINGKDKNDGGLRGFGFSEDVVKEVCKIANIDYSEV